MNEKESTTHNLLGLHARFAQMLSEAANQFSSNIYIQEGQMKVSAKNVMGIMISSFASSGSNFLNFGGQTRMSRGSDN
jgi:phosphotransferase system HPr (HPr) family protein